MLQIQIFRGSAPDPAAGAHGAAQIPIADREGLAPPPNNPIPALGSSGLVSTGLRV